MTGGRIDGLPAGPCTYCGQQTIMRVRVRRAGWLRLLLGPRESPRWACVPCIGLQLERLARR